jgi:glycosyltransferase involved in cell wall biosynthesis
MEPQSVAHGERGAEPSRPAPRTILIISQVYVPDPTSVGQHMADAAAALARRGHRVVVLTSANGFEDPSIRYPAREVLDGVEIRRLAFSSFGKRTIPLRLLGGGIFLLQAVARGVFVRGLDTVVVSTSPPMASFGGAMLQALRRIRLVFWVMDVNPDQMIALGHTSEGSLLARGFDWLIRVALRRADRVIVLDRFMAARVNRKHDVRAKLDVIPPWPHEDQEEGVAHADNPFRRQHGLTGKMVVMYSGNHSPSNPVSTLIEAARRLRDEPRMVFLFIGGGSGMREVEAAMSECPNVRSLPYEPLDRLKYSLAAADVHVVTVGDRMVGIVHPCKVYGAMAAARPILLFGPAECHASDFLGEGTGWRVAHGDVQGAVRVLRGLLDSEPGELVRRGARARRIVLERLTKNALCGRLCEVIEGRRALP